MCQLLLLVRTRSRECKEWVDAELLHVGYTMRPVDMPIRMFLLHHCVGIAGARVVLPPTTWELTTNTAAEIAAGVTLVGQKGVVLAPAGGYYGGGLVVWSKGVCFEAVHLLGGRACRRTRRGRRPPRRRSARRGSASCPRT